MGTGSVLPRLSTMARLRSCMAGPRVLGTCRHNDAAPCFDGERVALVADPRHHARRPAPPVLGRAARHHERNNTHKKTAVRRCWRRVQLDGQRVSKARLQTV